MTPAELLSSGGDLVTVAGVLYGVYRYQWVRRSHDLPTAEAVVVALEQLRDLSPREAARERFAVAAAAQELADAAADRHLRTHAATAGAVVGRLNDVDAVSVDYENWRSDASRAAKQLRDRVRVIRRRT